MLVGEVRDGRAWGIRERGGGRLRQGHGVWAHLCPHLKAVPVNHPGGAEQCSVTFGGAAGRQCQPRDAAGAVEGAGLALAWVAKARAVDELPLPVHSKQRHREQQELLAKGGAVAGTRCLCQGNMHAMLLAL